jgi:hypothetical protein
VTTAAGRAAWDIRPPGTAGGVYGTYVIPLYTSELTVAV